MNIFEKLLKNNFIKIEEILLTFHKKIGLTLEQTFLFIKVINFQEKNNFFEIQLFKKENSEIFDGEFVEQTISFLYSKKFVEVTTKNNKMIFSFSLFWKKMEIWLSDFPLNKDNDEKIEWILFNVSLPEDYSLEILKLYFDKNQKYLEEYLIKKHQNKITFENVIKYVNDKQNLEFSEKSFNEPKVIDQNTKKKLDLDNKKNVLKNSFKKPTKKETKEKLSQKNWFE